MQGLGNIVSVDASLPLVKPVTRSSFPTLAGALAHDIAATSAKLERLIQLARKTGVYDSGEIEHDQLAQTVQKDIHCLKNRIGLLAPLYMRRNKQAEKFSSGVLEALQLQLSDTTVRFRDVLTQRTFIVHAQDHTRKQFTGQLSEGAALMCATSPHGNGDQQHHSDFKDEYAPLLMIISQNQVLEERAIAAQQIGSQIEELHQIYQQLNNMIAHQHELTIRIDENVEDSWRDTESAWEQIEKIWRKNYSNRWLYFKLFAVLVVFVTLFLVFFV